MKQRNLLTIVVLLLYLFAISACGENPIKAGCEKDQSTNCTLQGPTPSQKDTPYDRSTAISSISIPKEEDTHIGKYMKQAEPYLTWFSLYKRIENMYKISKSKIVFEFQGWETTETATPQKVSIYAWATDKILPSGTPIQLAERASMLIGKDVTINPNTGDFSVNIPQDFALILPIFGSDIPILFKSSILSGRVKVDRDGLKLTNASLRGYFDGTRFVNDLTTEMRQCPSSCLTKVNQPPYANKIVNVFLKTGTPICDAMIVNQSYCTVNGKPHSLETTICKNFNDFCSNDAGYGMGVIFLGNGGIPDFKFQLVGEPVTMPTVTP